MHITGGCRCGELRYEADVDPATLGICHCTDCQVLSGSAFRATIRTQPGTFRFVQGTPRIYVKTAESGRPREQSFCGTCGSPIYSRAPGVDDFSLRAGTIDQRAQLTPAAQIWTRSRVPWLDAIADLPAFERGRSG